MTHSPYRTHTLIRIVAFSAALFLFAAQTGYAAEFNVTTPQGAPDDGMVHVEITATTDQHNPFNAADGSLTYPSDLFKVASISTDDSIFGLWAVPPTDDGSGTIRFAGGTQAAGGFIFTGVLFDVTLIPLKDGDGTVTVKDGTILAHDGIGTNILTGTNGKEYRIENAIPASYDTNGDGVISLEELSIGLTSS